MKVGEPTFLEVHPRRRRTGERVEIDYWSAGRDELTTRRIDPAVRVLRDGRVVRRRVLPPGQRRANVPRRPHSRAARPTGEHFETTSSDDTIADVFHPHADDLADHARVGAERARGLPRRYPAESITTRPDGTIELVLAVSEPIWLERLLVRLGPEARVIHPQEARRAGSDAADRVLARYNGGNE